MDSKREHEMRKATSGSVKGTIPSEKGGSRTREAQEWGGGSKAAKGPITEKDRCNENSSQKR